MKMAVVCSDRVIHIFDSEGERKDKFSTKPAPKGGCIYYCHLSYLYVCQIYMYIYMCNM